MTRPCPRCARQNAAHRAACLYCGEPLPDPAPPPEAPRARAMPADLDRLVAEALRGKGVKALHEALRQAREGAGSEEAARSGAQAAGEHATDVTGATDATLATPAIDATPATDATGEERSPGAVARATDAAGLDAEGLDEGLTRDPHAQVLAALVAVEEAAASARARLTAGDLEAAAVLLRQLAAGLPGRLPAPAAGPTASIDLDAGEGDAAPVPLPPFRFGWALVIDGLADAARAPTLASALGQDLATARLHAVATHPKVVQRGDDEAALLARVERLRAEGVGASLLHRSMVQTLGRPPLARSFVWGGPVMVLEGRAYWEGDPEETRGLRGAPWPWAPPVLGVLGEVTVVRSRSASAPGRFARKTLGTGPTVLDERRIGVLDLWAADGGQLRLVEGLSDAGDARVPFRSLVEAITAAAPGLRLTGRRVCRPEEGRAAGEPGESVSRSGWPSFEEHTRLCWLHLRPR